MTHLSPQLHLVLGALIFGFVGFAQAGTGVSDSAPAVDFYVGLTEECCGEDPHPVHGIQTPDGGYALVGKTVDSGGEWDG